MFINTKDTIVKVVMNIEHCSQNFKNYSQKISLFSYIQFLGLMALTLLEPSTSLTPHCAVPPSLCHRILACCFTTALYALSLVSTRIPHCEENASPSAVRSLCLHEDTACASLNAGLI